VFVLLVFFAGCAAAGTRPAGFDTASLSSPGATPTAAPAQNPRGGLECAWIPPAPFSGGRGGADRVEEGQPSPPRAGDPEPVIFPTSDGGVVHADLYGEGRRAVVLAPGGRFERGSWRSQAEVLARAGFRVLAIDFRGEGGSRGGPGWDGSDETFHLDVLAAVDYLRDSGAESVSMVGASLGGWAAARAAAAAPRDAIERLVLLAAPGIEEPERIRARTLFISARDDRDGRGTRRLDRIRAQYERASGPKELLVLDGSAHAQHLFATDQGAELMGAIVDFLSTP